MTIVSDNFEDSSSYAETMILNDDANEKSASGRNVKIRAMVSIFN